MTLYEECLEVLGNSVKELSFLNGRKLVEIFGNMFPFTRWARIDWEKVQNKMKLDSTAVNQKDEVCSYLFDLIKKIDQEVYIIWDDSSLPVIKSDLIKVLDSIDDVKACSFDTWIFSPSQGYVIEYYHEGEVTVGVVENIVS